MNNLILLILSYLLIVHSTHDLHPKDQEKGQQKLPKADPTKINYEGMFIIIIKIIIINTIVINYSYYYHQYHYYQMFRDDTIFIKESKRNTTHYRYIERFRT